MDAFIVYYGTVNCDNHDSYPTHRITTFQTAEEVEKFYADFIETLREDDSKVEFRVFKGNEMMLKEVEKVTTYKLGEI